MTIDEFSENILKLFFPLFLAVNFVKLIFFKKSK